VAFATMARGDVMDIDGRRRRIATIIQHRSGFTLQFTDTTTVRVLCPPDTCQIDGRTVRLDEIPAGRCLWCPSQRPLVPVGRYTTQSNRTVVVYACTGCVQRHHLLPLAFRNDTTTDVRRRPAKP
jgi:hypothetical protein